MNHAVESTMQTLEESLAYLPQTEKAAHNKAGAFEYIPLNMDYFIDQLTTALKILKVADRDEEVKFIDVGCGIGTKLLLAGSLSTVITPYGIEMNRRYATQARRLMTNHASRMFNFPRPRFNPYQVMTGDARKHDYSSYDIVYFYCPMLDHDKQVALETQIYKTAKKGALILANLKHVRDEEMASHKLKQVSADDQSWMIYKKVQ